MIELLDTLDEFEDDSYGAFLDYSVMMHECESNEPKFLYIDESHEFYEEMKTFAQADHLQIVATEGVTKIC